MWGTWREGFFTGDPERYAKALEMGVCFRRGSTFGERVGTLFYWGARRRLFP